METVYRAEEPKSGRQCRLERSVGIGPLGGKSRWGHHGEILSRSAIPKETVRNGKSPTGLRTPPETPRHWQTIGKRATVDRAATSRAMRWHILGRQDGKSAVSRRSPPGERFRLIILHECTNGHAWTTPLVPRLGAPPDSATASRSDPDLTRTAVDVAAVHVHAIAAFPLVEFKCPRRGYLQP